MVRGGQQDHPLRRHAFSRAPRGARVGAGAEKGGRGALRARFARRARRRHGARSRGTDPAPEDRSRRPRLPRVVRRDAEVQSRAEPDELTSLRARSRAGETLLGCFLTWPTSGVIELAAITGFDFVVLDCEHGFFSIESVASAVLAADGAGIGAIVRAPSAVSEQVGRYLDAGAAGTLLPRVESVAMARTAIEALKFAPEGKRGLGGVRANRYATMPLADFVRQADDDTLVVVQIEREGALADLASIADLPVVDVLFVGPNDLSQALGSPGDTASERFRAEVARV